MSAAPLYPLVFRPVYKDYVWGGDRILRTFHRSGPPGVYAESWEISTRPEGPSLVAEGPLAGARLTDLCRDRPAELLGAAAGPNGHFPLLLKLIDAREVLSVQVHPDDANAALTGGEPKTEMWYFLETDPGVRIVAGLVPGTNPDTLRGAIRQGAVEPVLQFLPVQPGDAVFIPGGLVHALDRGCLILEIQQNSNTTYRLHDWGRVGADGQPRATHVDEAMKVIRWNLHGERVTPRPLAVAAPNRGWELKSCPQFRLERFELAAPMAEPGRDGGFAMIFVAKGNLRLRRGGETWTYPAGTSVLIPAALPPLALEPGGADGAALLRVTVPARV
jgi:mannose-6-phosphate isomerase